MNNMCLLYFTWSNCLLNVHTNYYLELWSHIVLCLPQNGSTPLHIAASHGKDDAVKVLLEKGANIDAVDNVSYMYMHL